MFEGQHGQEDREQALRMLQDDYSQFRDFYWDCSTELLGFEPSDMQLDIADYLQYGPMNAMIQAQRGEAKTTITYFYAVWCLIHDPSTIIMILSAGSKMATQIATGCINTIYGMDMLECLRTDKSHAGARCSVEAFDVHWQLKGADKSPSICCMGLTSNNQGYRAHLLVADDIESKENSGTAVQREKILDKSRELSSFVQSGRIVYLGTPQTEESIYNTLYSRGFEIRIWPGRIPTPTEMTNYLIGEYNALAPYVQAQIAQGWKRTGFGVLGTRGEVTDPVMQSEERLLFQETDKGPANFDLQYMLNTKLSDAERFPLKPSNLLFYGLSKEQVPGTFLWGKSPDKIFSPPHGLAIQENLYLPVKVSEEWFEYQGKYISIDPAGGGANADETGYAVLYVCNGYIFIMEAGGIPGGFEKAEMVKMCNKITEWGCHTAIIEKNYGNGAYGSALRAVMQELEINCGIEDVWSSGQKERRIIADIEPILGLHKLVVNTSAVAHDIDTTGHYPNEMRSSYSWLYQLARLTKEKNSLRHDDRLEAISQGCGFLHKKIQLDAQKAEAEKIHRSQMQFIQSPTGLFRKANIRRYTSDGQVLAAGISGNLMDKFKR